jgi:hypothetical protein
VVAPALESLGRVHEAIALAKEFEKSMPEPFRFAFVTCRAYFEGDYQAASEALERTYPLDDPEASFYSGCFRQRRTRLGLLWNV